MNLREKVLDYLQTNKTINRWQAVGYCNACDYRTIIRDLRRQGYAIVAHKRQGADDQYHLEYELIS